MPYSIEVGMDVHKMFSVFAAVNGSGEVMSCEKLSNDTGIFDQYFSQKDPGLRQFYEYLVKLKGKGIARVAVARKLMRSVFFVLKKSKPYQYRRMQSIWSHDSR